MCRGKRLNARNDVTCMSVPICITPMNERHEAYTSAGETCRRESSADGVGDAGSRTALIHPDMPGISLRGCLPLSHTNVTRYNGTNGKNAGGRKPGTAPSSVTMTDSRRDRCAERNGGEFVNLFPPSFLAQARFFEHVIALRRKSRRPIAAHGKQWRHSARKREVFRLANEFTRGYYCRFKVRPARLF